MAERRPLCLINGVVSMLPAGDTLPASGGSSPVVLRLTDKTIRTVTAATTSSSTPNLTIPANTLQVGDTIEIVSTYRVTNGTTASNFLVNVATGGASRVLSTTALGTTAVANRTHTVRWTFVVESVGATTSMSVEQITTGLASQAVVAGAATGVLTTMGSSLVDMVVTVVASTSAATATGFTHQRTSLEIIR